MWLRSPTLLSEAPGADPLQLSRIGHLIWHDTLGVCICQGAHGALPAQSHLASTASAAPSPLLPSCSVHALFVSLFLRRRIPTLNTLAPPARDTPGALRDSSAAISPTFTMFDDCQCC